MHRSVLVTGATSGIGLETVLHLAHLGFRAIGTARSPEKAERLAATAKGRGLDVEVRLLDVADEDACVRVLRDLDLWGLVNNAGYLNLGLVQDVPDADVRRQVETMVLGPVRLARLALPAMARRGDGRIVNVSSVAGHGTGPMLGWYQAMKHALTAVTDALRIELASAGVDVVLVEPGAYLTAIWDKGADDIARRRALSRHPRAYDRAQRVLERVRPLAGDPAGVAEVIGDVLTAGRPRPRYLVGRDAPVLDVLNLAVPRRLQDRALRAVFQL